MVKTSTRLRADLSGVRTRGERKRSHRPWAMVQRERLAAAADIDELHGSNALEDEASLNELGESTRYGKPS